MREPDAGAPAPLPWSRWARSCGATGRGAWPWAVRRTSRGASRRPRAELPRGAKAVTGQLLAGARPTRESVQVAAGRAHARRGAGGSESPEPMKFDTPATTNPIDQLNVVGKPTDRMEEVRSRPRARPPTLMSGTTSCRTRRMARWSARPSPRARSPRSMRATRGTLPACSPSSRPGKPARSARATSTWPACSGVPRSSTITRRSRSSWPPPASMPRASSSARPWRRGSASTGRSGVRGRPDPPGRSHCAARGGRGRERPRRRGRYRVRRPRQEVPAIDVRRALRRGRRRHRDRRGPGAAHARGVRRGPHPEPRVGAARSSAR